MEHAVLQLHQPVDYTIRDGVHFEASRIAVIQNEESSVIRVSGVILGPGGPVSRILVIQAGLVDLWHFLQDTVRTLLASGDYETI